MSQLKTLPPNQPPRVPRVRTLTKSRSKHVLRQDTKNDLFNNSGTKSLAKSAGNNRQNGISRRTKLKSTSLQGPVSGNSEVINDIGDADADSQGKEITKLPSIFNDTSQDSDNSLHSASSTSIKRNDSDISLPDALPAEPVLPVKVKPPLRKRKSVIAAIKPENQDAERQRFFCCNFHYNPTFLYRSPATAPMLEKFNSASDRLLNLAVKIMDNALKKHGSYEEFEKRTGGRQLSRAQIMDAAKTYLSAEGIEDEVDALLVDDLVARASMSRVKGKPTLRVRTSNMRKHWMIGLLRHELGTHYLRSCNNRYQIWHKTKMRNDLELEPLNPTEEGLASLHSVIFREDPCLWRCALLYYTIYKASQLSFRDLFQDLGRFLVDPNVRWDYCLRAKRGQIETSGPGAFCKDQVYLEGALQLLKHRRTLDFHTLVRLGKISYLDCDRLRLLGNYRHTRIPSFMENLPRYLDGLQDIVTKNGLTDEDLIDV